MEEQVEVYTWVTALVSLGMSSSFKHSSFTASDLVWTNLRTVRWTVRLWGWALVSRMGVFLKESFSQLLQEEPWTLNNFKFRDCTRNKKWMLHVFTVENLIILILEEGNQLGRLFHFQQTPVLSKVAYFHLGTIGKLEGNFLKLPTSFFSAICFCTPPSP